MPYAMSWQQHSSMTARLTLSHMERLPQIGDVFLPTPSWMCESLPFPLFLSKHQVMTIQR
jgi:hypothetical protein